MKLYKAIIWKGDDASSHRLPTESLKDARTRIFEEGKRVTVLAESLKEARHKLEAEHGNGTVYDLYNEEDAARPR